MFLDYNQNAKDRTIAAAYSVRPLPDAQVSAPLTWEEVPECDPAEFTLRTMPDRLARRGDLAAGMDRTPGSLDRLLELAARHEVDGLGGDAPWPPHFRKRRSEPQRVAPSRVSRMPLLVVARARTEAEAQAGLERWKRRHPQAAAHVQVEDVLVDAMRGRSSTWTRIRVNLRHVPEPQRPPPEPPDPDYDPWSG